MQLGRTQIAARAGGELHIGRNDLRTCWNLNSGEAQGGQLITPEAGWLTIEYEVKGTCIHIDVPVLGLLTIGIPSGIIEGCAETGVDAGVITATDAAIVQHGAPSRDPIAVDRLAHTLATCVPRIVARGGIPIIAGRTRKRWSIHLPKAIHGGTGADAICTPHIIDREGIAIVARGSGQGSPPRGTLTIDGLSHALAGQVPRIIARGRVTIIASRSWLCRTTSNTQAIHWSSSTNTIHPDHIVQGRRISIIAGRTWLRRSTTA